MDLQLEMPSVVAQKLISRDADIGLVPVAVIPLLSNPRIVSPYCIGAVGPVDSVMLYSETPVENLDTIYLDYQSRTSVRLAQLLAREHWKVNPEFVNAEPGFEEKIGGNTGGVVIGDRTFLLNKKFKYCYDLAEEWQKMTGLPFVFAAWVSLGTADEDFLNRFSSALEYGLDHREEALKGVSIPGANEQELIHYINKSISYDLDSDKQKGLDLFLNQIKKHNF